MFKEFRTRSGCSGQKESRVARRDASVFQYFCENTTNPPARCRVACHIINHNYHIPRTTKTTVATNHNRISLQSDTIDHLCSAICCPIDSLMSLLVLPTVVLYCTLLVFVALPPPGATGIMHLCSCGGPLAPVRPGPGVAGHRGRA